MKKEITIIILILIIVILIGSYNMWREKEDCQSLWWVYVYNTRWSELCYVNWFIVKSY